MSSATKQELIARQRELDETMTALYQERKEVSAQLRRVEKRERENSLLAALLKLQAAWSVERPTVVPLVSHLQRRFSVNRGPNAGGFTGISNFSSAALDPQEVSIACHFEVRSWKRSHKGLRKVVAVVNISKPGPGNDVLFSTKKTFKNLFDYDAGISELYYQAVTKAVRKLTDTE